MDYHLLTASNPKALKSLKYGWLTAVLHLLPHKLSGKDFCPFASPGCAEACLNSAGNPAYEKGKHNARYERSRFLIKHPQLFITMLMGDLAALVRNAEKLGVAPACRLNGTSDIIWEKKFPQIFEAFPMIQFYDYTKVPNRRPPDNYHLTFSRSEINEELARAQDHSIAIVFDGRKPETWWGRQVIDGDEHDLRFLDPARCIVALSPKGLKGKRDKSGFVIRLGAQT